MEHATTTVSPNQPPTEETALVERTKRAVRAYMSSQPQFDASHDYAHLQRVLSMAEHILEVVERTLDPPARGYDHTAIRLAALLHDVDDRKYLGPSSSNDSSQKIEEEETPGGVAKQMLLDLGCSSALASKVQDIVSCVSYTTERNDPQLVQDILQIHPELAVVQDADRLDAIGAVGIARAFTYGGAKDRKGGLEATLLHFDEKLLGLENLMKTQEGNRLAKIRSCRLEHFKQWWEDETKLEGMSRTGAI
ncbi:MAG: hypothetical protein LQ341_001127 [Variospora aurantia]|nr:MAG: hypothetical protein LQ341_001127 [Variospora aurantia]